LQSESAEVQATALGTRIAKDLVGTSIASNGVLPEAVRDVASQHLGVELPDVALRSDHAAQIRTQRRSACAIAEGTDIYFDRHQSLTSGAGHQLLGHELAHVAQQLVGGMVVPQAQARGPREAQLPAYDEVANIPSLAALRGWNTDLSGVISNIDNPDEVTEQARHQHARLPYLRDGWNAGYILTFLAQRDTISQTDSDARRCTQAIAFASRILQGPEEAAAFLSLMCTRGLLEQRVARPRMISALAVLNTVAKRIRGKIATHGDLSWAIEALHDLFYSDDVGTPEGEVMSQIAPVGGGPVLSMSTWCGDATQLFELGSSIASGEQLILIAHSVSVNARFEQLTQAQDDRITRAGTRPQLAPGTNSTALEIVEPNNHTRRVFIRRISTARKPAAQDLDPNRDAFSGHQIMLYKAGTELYLYDPESADRGQHLRRIANAQSLSDLFADAPANSFFRYVKAIARFPNAPTASPWGAVPQTSGIFRP
jgi:hypothetical protein